MAAPAPSPQVHPLHRLVLNLVFVVLLAAVLFLIFTSFNQSVLSPFSREEVLLLEAGAILLVAFAVARSFTSASDEVLRRRGQVQHGASVRIFLNLIVAVVALLALFDLAGVSAQSIFLGSAFAGIVLGLAAQTVLSNVFAGLLLVMANPFRPGDRVSFISSSYGAFAPSYPHEMVYPSYAGTVEDVELLYTVLRLDAGGIAKVPNSVVIGALILQPRIGIEKGHRVRMTFPLTVPVATVEAALADVRADFPEESARAPPRLELVDVSAASWDGVVLLWSPIADDGTVRDRVMRAVLARLSPATPAPPPK